MNAIKELKVLGQKIKIILTTDENNLVHDGTKCDGLWKLQINTIYLDAKMPNDKILATLMHELAHAISDILVLGMEENSIIGISTGYFQILSDNKTIMLTLVEEFTK